MQVFITGVSRGLGLALVQEYLGQGHHVTGIGRKNVTDHPHYIFLPCDLASWENVENLRVEITPGEAVLLINNAGIIEPVQRISDQQEDHSHLVFQVNTIAPIQLMRKFLRACEVKESELTILNISSGAGRRAIPSWANYCASKAALDLFSETLQLEEREKGTKTKVYSVAPGVIDTDMQAQIRSVDRGDFSSLENFQKLFRQRELRSPADVARALRLALETGKFTETVTRTA